MTASELNNKFVELYNIMATSNNANYMKVFGETMQQMIADLIEESPDKASNYIERLDTIRWQNFLTKEEAAAVIDEMRPKAKWGLNDWIDKLQGLGIDTCEEPFYNRYALYVVMNMVYSDHINTISIIAGKSLGELSDDDVVAFAHALAIDLLKDEDKVFDVRSYFKV